MPPTVERRGPGARPSGSTATRCTAATSWSSPTRCGATCRWSSGSSASAATRSPAATRRGTAHGQRHGRSTSPTSRTQRPRLAAAPSPPRCPPDELFLLGDNRSGLRGLPDPPDGRRQRHGAARRGDRPGWTARSGRWAGWADWTASVVVRRAARRAVAPGPLTLDRRRRSARAPVLILGGAGRTAPIAGRPGRGGGGAETSARGPARPADRILLMHGYEPDDPSTPGGSPRRRAGGREPGGGGLREVAEETGITSMTLGPVLWRRSCAFAFDGRRWEQDEWYFLGRTEVTRTDTGGHTELERRSVRGAALVDLPRNCRPPVRRCTRPGSPSCCARCSTRVPRDRRWCWTPRSTGARRLAHNGGTNG